MILGSVVAILIFVWFYNTAPALERKPLEWAVAGFVVYFMVAFFWSYAINPGIKDAAMHTRNTLLMYIVRYAYIVVAATCAVIFNLKFGKKKSG